MEPEKPTDYATITWSNIPIGGKPGLVIVYATWDRGPWWKRIWRGRWRRYEYKSEAWRPDGYSKG